MSHTSAVKDQLVARVRRIVGQLEGVERLLHEGAGCEDVLHRVAGARGAINGLTDEILADFIREHVAGPKINGEARSKAGEDLIAAMRRYSK